MGKLIKPEVRKWVKWPVVVALVIGWICAAAWFWKVIRANWLPFTLVLLLALVSFWAYHEFFAKETKG